MGKAINDGMATVDETFPSLGHAPGKALDDFANSGGKSPPATGEAAAPETPAPSPEGAAATPHPVKAEVGFKLLQLASGTEPKAHRLESLDIAHTMLEQQFIEDADMMPFVDMAASYARKVINGELSLDDAKKYLEAMAG